MATGGVEIIAGTGGILRANIGATIDEQLHEHTPQLGEVLVELVQAKTPVRRHALIEDVAFEAYPDPGDSELVFVYAGEEHQLGAWHRVYAQYQEGPPMGLDTYTNPPRHMFAGTAEGDGVGFVEDWAVTYVQLALDMCAGGAGVSI